jgi:Protein of unknown function (DUF3297)
LISPRDSGSRDNRGDSIIKIIMNDQPGPPALPDHLSVDPRSPHHVAAVFEHDVGIRFNGQERRDVEEYCISEGWVKVPAGKTLDRKGQPLMIKLKGKVEAFYR